MSIIKSNSHPLRLLLVLSYLYNRKKIVPSPASKDTISI